jgi:hypothetical protein
MNESELEFLTLLEQDNIQPLSSEFFDRIEKLKFKAEQNLIDNQDGQIE